MANNLHKDNKSGDSSFETGNSEGGTTATNIPPTQVDDVASSQHTGFNDLPSNQTVSSRAVNWLGSSYSGVDIKVVAHLYDTNNSKDTEIATLEQQVEVIDRIVDALGLYIDGGVRAYTIAKNDKISTLEGRIAFNWQAMIDLWYSVGGITDAPQAVKGHMLGYLIELGAGQTLITGKMMQDLHAHQAMSTSFNDRITDLKAFADDATTTVTLAALQTISVQSHREKYAVRALGHSYVKGYSRGPRSIAGSMVFTVFNEHSLLQLIRSMQDSKTYGEMDPQLSTLIPDQLPPIDLTVAFANEYGSLSELRLFGVEFVNDGTTYSIEDLLTENIINFVARDADVLTSAGAIRLSRLQAGLAGEPGTSPDTTGSSLLFSNERYSDYLDTLGVRRRLKNR